MYVKPLAVNETNNSVDNLDRIFPKIHFGNFALSGVWGLNASMLKINRTKHVRIFGRRRGL